MFKKLFWTWVAIIWIIALIPRITAPEVKINENFKIRFDYIAHASFYFILTTFYFLWKIKQLKPFRIKSHLIFIFLGIALAMLTEFAQKFLPNRGFNYLDMANNFAGLALGILFMLIWLRKLSGHSDQ